jgi:hypothetical protein
VGLLRIECRFSLPAHAKATGREGQNGCLCCAGGGHAEHMWACRCCTERSLLVNVRDKDIQGVCSGRQGRGGAPGSGAPGGGDWCARTYRCVSFTHHEILFTWRGLKILCRQRVVCVMSLQRIDRPKRRRLLVLCVLELMA